MTSASAYLVSREEDMLANVEYVEFAASFNGSLENVVWPEGVWRTAFNSRGGRGKFNQPILNVVWPESLQQHTLENLDQPMNQGVWPGSLQQLTVGFGCNQPNEELVAAAAHVRVRIQPAH